MLGELDVIGEDVHEPGARLPSMMTPTLALVDGRPRLALGSAGSVRLSGAILQVLVRVVAGGIARRRGDRPPRLHVDGETVHVEGGWDARVADALADEGWDVVRWAGPEPLLRRHERRSRRVRTGRAGAAGDPRRGGYGAVVR